MRKCLLFLLLIALPLAALAEPLTQIADLTGTVCWPDGTDEDTAAYRYSYVYPQVAGDGETETTINIYYANRSTMPSSSRSTAAARRSPIRTAGRTRASAIA